MKREELTGSCVLCPVVFKCRRFEIFRIFLGWKSSGLLDKLCVEKTRSQTCYSFLSRYLLMLETEVKNGFRFLTGWFQGTFKWRWSVTVSATPASSSSPWDGRGFGPRMEHGEFLFQNVQKALSQHNEKFNSEDSAYEFTLVDVASKSNISFSKCDWRICKSLQLVSFIFLTFVSVIIYYP